MSERPGYRSDNLSRTARVRAAAPDERGDEARLSVRPVEGRLRGELVLVDVDGHTTRREVDGDSCAEVTSALTLITALALDPNASIEPLALPVVAPKPPPKVEPVRAPAPPPARPQSWRFGGGADLTIAFGVAPNPLLAATAFLTLSGAAASSPSLRLAFERSTTDHLELAQGAADFRWTSGVLEVSPLRLRAGRVGLTPSVVVEVGALEASGEKIVPPRSATLAWVAAGAGARCAVDIVGPLAAEASLAFDVPFTRERFFFEPDVTVHRASVIGGRGAIGFAARFR